MKLSTIAKTSLALGILTTGVITTNAQPADAATQVEVKSNSQDVQKLHDYYSQNGFDFYNVTGDKNGDKAEIVTPPQLTNVLLKGTDKVNLNDGHLSNIDVFVVREDSSRQSANNSIGGITKSNSKDFIDHVIKTPLTLVTKEGEYTISNGLAPFDIKKEEISLKELDFKLRKQLIKDHGLYTGNKKDGVIVVKMNGGEKDKYSFELDKKLQDHRMGDVVDSKNIKEIIVEFK
ncbi:superantigen-like protein [Staphylococcus agnetis]|uniref:Superantigen-like protein n=1 Tax=Staphylococcus agnetis TaxID=985762 RepID=A0ABD7TU98_9STAP|nr:superantigen-like protein [Staphylococcus agnetis]UXU57324.1 superantigen-like protein [Staphylococcus agnetis]